MKKTILSILIGASLAGLAIYTVQSVSGNSSEPGVAVDIKERNGAPNEKGQASGFGEQSFRNFRNANRRYREQEIREELSQVRGEIDKIKLASAVGVTPGKKEVGQMMEPEDPMVEFKRSRTNAFNHFESETRNPEWADRVERDFESDFIKEFSASPGTGSYKGISCRSSHCVADIVWPDYKSARQEHFRFVATRFKNNCRIMSFIPPSVENPDSEYKHQILFNCSGINDEDR